MDIDGRYNYSNIVSASVNCNSAVIQVYPTITESRVKVVLPQEYAQAAIQLYNNLGQRVSPVITGSGTVRTVDLHRLSDGWYLLQVINNNEIKSFKVIKQ